MDAAKTGVITVSNFANIPWETEAKILVNLMSIHHPTLYGQYPIKVEIAPNPCKLENLSLVTGFAM